MSFFSSFFGYINFRKIIKESKNKVIIFYSESKNYRNYFGDLIKETSLNKDFTVIYLTSDKDDIHKVSDFIKPIFIGSNFFRILLFTFLECDLLIMTLTDLGNHVIKKSKKCKNYLYIFHSLVSTHKSYSYEAFKNYDIILTNGEYQKKELEFAEDKFSFPKKKLFNTGYIYFDKLMKNKKDVSISKKILFAPSWNKLKENLFDDYTEVIVKDLIKKDYHVVLRTHPESLKRSKSVIKSLNKLNKITEKFEINSDLTRLDILNESSVLITDNGGMGMEYIIVQKKPVIFINYKDKIHNYNFQKFKDEPIENKFKKEFGVEVDVKDLKNLDIKIKEAIINFKNKKENIDLFVKDSGIITQNQIQNAKSIITKIL